MREIPEGEYARLWIGGLESTVTEEDLRKKFETVGRLVDVKIRSARSLSSRSGRSVHIFGYVEYETRELAKEVRNFILVLFPFGFLAGSHLRRM